MYTAYYSDTAIGLMEWAFEENHRIKAVRISKVAQSVEQRYRETHQDEINDPYRKAVMPLPKFD